METATPTEHAPFYFVNSAGKLEFNPHIGQKRALLSKSRFVLVSAGTQSGKTSTGPLWLLREIQTRGTGDYMCVAPSYPLMLKKMLPEFILLFQTYLRLGEYKHGDRIFHFNDGKTKIFFGHAEDPESLESATAKAAWLDEAGQNRFRLGSWEAILRRLSIHQGRVLITTTPYNLGWMKTQVYDRWKPGDKDYHVINFESRMNPVFPAAEWERARDSLPPWRFRMFYCGLFERPAGLIYDCFDESSHTCPPFAIPDSWERFVGMDFGGINTAAVFAAKEPNGKYYVYREYWPRLSRTAKQHAVSLLDGELRTPTTCGSKSEQQWRDEFAASGIPIFEPPVADVEVGINRIYKLFANNRIKIFSTLTQTIDQLQSYSRELDDQGSPTDDIADKGIWHLCDAFRYFAAFVESGGLEFKAYV